MAVFLQHFSSFLTAYGIALALNWKLALVIASVLPILIFLTGIIAKVQKTIDLVGNACLMS